VCVALVVLPFLCASINHWNIVVTVVTHSGDEPQGESGGHGWWALLTVCTARQHMVCKPYTV